MASLLLTVIGDDRSGLVDALAGVIVDHGGSWDESHMTQLAGKFAGIVLVTIPDAKVSELVDALGPLEADGLLDITIERAGGDSSTEAASQWTLSLVGQDRPGIVHEIAQTLASRDVNIVDLRTLTRSAPMAGGMLFEAEAILEVPAGVSLENLCTSLEDLADELMVDIDLAE